MVYLMFGIAAVSAYLISGINPAIIMSKAIYHRDIRECGSKNPGFTNFRRSFSKSLAWVVLVLDLLKSALPAVVFGLLIGNMYGLYQLGVTFTCFCSMLGHAYPVWYGFKGGKGFLVCLSAMWVLDYRIGIIATALMLILLFTTKYMSLSTMLAMVSCPITLAIIGMESIYALIFCILSVLFMINRHKANIVRLFKGTESKFFKSKKENTKE